MDRRFFSRAAGGVLVGLTEVFAVSARAEPATKPHRVVFQVSSSEAALMNLVLNNAMNLADFYKAKGETSEIEIVVFGPGYSMVRDTSPVKARIAELRTAIPTLVVSACQNSRRAIARAEGKKPEDILQVPEATDVPAGVVRITELQEQGWSYLRP